MVTLEHKPELFDPATVDRMIGDSPRSSRLRWLILGNRSADQLDPPGHFTHHAAGRRVTERVRSRSESAMNKIFVIAVLITTSLVHAESLEERRYWKAEMRDIEDYRAEAVQSCGVELTFEYIGKDALRADAERAKYLPHVLCGYIVKEVGSQCRDGEKQKASVAAKVKGIQCTFGDKRSVTVKNGIVLLKGNGDMHSLAGYVRDQLKAKF
jgi:hypothetical protein